MIGRNREKSECHGLSLPFEGRFSGSFRAECVDLLGRWLAGNALTPPPSSHAREPVMSLSRACHKRVIPIHSPTRIAPAIRLAENVALERAIVIIHGEFQELNPLPGQTIHGRQAVLRQTKQVQQEGAILRITALPADGQAPVILKLRELTVVRTSGTPIARKRTQKPCG